MFLSFLSEPDAGRQRKSQLSPWDATATRWWAPRGSYAHHKHAAVHKMVASSNICKYIHIYIAQPQFSEKLCT